MFNVEEFNSFIKENHNQKIIFIHNEQVQSLINNSTVCTCENIERLIINIMNNEFFVEVLSGYPNYQQSYDLFLKSFASHNYNRFNYFYCTLATTDNRVVVIFPLKYRSNFYKRLLKIGNLKAFI
jgi:hypothetical protein